MTSNVFYVYEHWRTDRDECFYVGKGKGNRAYCMKKRNNHHKAIQGKLNRTGSAIEVKIVKSGISEQEAFELEVERIKFWASMNVDLANKTLGGEGVSGLPAWNRRKVICLEDGLNFASATEAAKYYKVSTVAVYDVCKDKYRSVKGLHFRWYDEPPKTIREVEDFHAKRRKRVDTNVNFRGVQNGVDEKGRKATGPMKVAKRVACMDDGKEFPSASEAARYYNVSKSAIIELCLGKNNRISVGGRAFKYVEKI